MQDTDLNTEPCKKVDHVHVAKKVENACHKTLSNSLFFLAKMINKKVHICTGQITRLVI